MTINPLFPSLHQKMFISIRTKFLWRARGEPYGKLMDCYCLDKLIKEKTHHFYSQPPIFSHFKNGQEICIIFTLYYVRGEIILKKQHQLNSRIGRFKLDNSTWLDPNGLNSIESVHSNTRRDLSMRYTLTTLLLLFEYECVELFLLDNM